MEQIDCVKKNTNSIDKVRLRVAMLCHVSNPEIRQNIPLVIPKWQNVFNKIVGRPHFDYSDYAPWNVNTIRGLGSVDDLELHVIVPHLGLRKWTYEYVDKGVYYHFFRPEPLFPWVIIEKLFRKKQYKDYPRTRKIVKSFIKSIQPDIVDLVGAENPYYSICGLDVEGIPLFITCQTVYSNPNREKMAGKVSKERWNLEQSLFWKADALCCMNTMYRDLILGYVPGAKVFPLIWPDSPFPKLKPCEKKYDFAFFSMLVSSKKGIDSALGALALVKKEKPHVSLLVVGHIENDYKDVIDKLVSEYDLTNNVIFHDFFPEQIDMFNYVKQARFALLPVKLDFISGTILQAMEMGMPIVTHITSGTPSLNKDRETVLLSEIGDTETMAKQMICLMEDDNLVSRLKENGLIYMQESHKKAAAGITQKVKQYKAVVDYYRHGIPIPKELLYNFDIKE